MDALERDFYEERRRKWRRSAFWRGFLVAAALGGVVWFLAARERGALTQEIARLDLSGIIADDVKRDALLADLAEDGDVRALILRINSPGGTTAGAEAVFAGLRAVAAEKPVVAVMSEMAASGGYVAALAADHLIARGNTLTGSIGVIMEYPDLTGMMARLGVGLETVRSSALKAEPSPFRPTSPAARAVDEALVADSYRWFRGLVGERRGLDGTALDDVANGQVFTGRLALAAGLVDELGGETEAIAWLESRDPGLKGLPVRDREVESERSLLASVLGLAAPSGGIIGEISRLTGPKLYSIGP
ncbi:signal peptide peptidase SppA [Amaricoccus sp.]|uniref:signal peptide peptidase SppA n=1 Tax=Amaricoccus sp. TaxID=1872485 RepID=UPI001B6C71C1|nr:signal peptide peptidase SppA [Amaricoccus sp.]MBP7003635.1 signal peptide peptidase SppA [Amaricoccus sp.]